MPKCLFRMLTGWDCPGCGSSRALHSLLHLRIWEALAYNPLLVAGIPYVILLAWSQYLGGREKFPRMHNAITSRAAIIVIIAIIVFYTVIRNVLWN